MKELGEIQAELSVPKSQRNKFGNYNYRSCEDILEALKPILKKHKCSVFISDEIALVGERHYVKATATLLNSEGKEIKVTASAREELTKKGMDGSQITGASSSYARKYALNGLFAIDDTKDADSMDNTKSEKPEVDEKPWLNEGDENYKKVVLWFEKRPECSDYIAEVRKKFKVSKPTEEKLTLIIRELGV